MCGGSSFQKVVNAFTNPSANISDSMKKDKTNSSGFSPVAATASTDATVAEAKQKQLNANKRNRRSTILANLNNSSSGGKTLLGS